jgi:CID domain
VVEIWEKQFNSSNKDHKVCLLYLANDILQNSKRKGGEYVNEFWKVLPTCLRYVYEHGEESGKKVVTRLVCFFSSFFSVLVTSVGTFDLHEIQYFFCSIMIQ